MLTLRECEDLLFESYNRVAPTLTGFDSDTRNLEAIQTLFAQVGVSTTPNVPVITVTGSKGKGSTTLLTGAILHFLGYRVGILTSPHFLDLQERIRLDGQMIGEADFTRIINQFATNITALDQTLQEGRYLSPTGLFLLVAMQYFAEQNATTIILEVGRGGRFDDVSIIENQVAILTPIMEEHLDKLGPTLADVAWHKSGVIKAGNTVISAPQLAEITEIIAAESHQKDAKLWQVGRQITYQQKMASLLEQEIDVSTDGQTQPFYLESPARYQGLNVALAYGASLAVAGKEHLHQNKVLARQLAQVRLAGRCDLVSSEPLVIVDGAINGEAALLLWQSIEPLYTQPLILVTALPYDKDYTGLLDILCPYVDTTIVTHVSATHLHFSHEVVDYAQTLCEDVLDEPKIMDAFQFAVDQAGKNGTVLVVGTQSLVRDALNFWHQNLNNLFTPQK